MENNSSVKENIQDVLKGKQAKKTIDVLKKLFAIQPILDQLRAGRVMMMVLGGLWRLIAVGAILGLLGTWVALWQLMEYAKFMGGLALIISQIFFLYAIGLAARTLFLRATEITLAPDSDYVVIPVIAQFIRTIGEVALIVCAVMSVPVLLTTWFKAPIIPLYFFRNAFFDGIIGFFLSFVVGFGVLVVTQLISEWVLAIFSIANDTNILRRHVSSGESFVTKDVDAPVDE